MTKKEIYTMSGQLVAASGIISDVMTTLLMNNKGETKVVVGEALRAVRKLNKALRAVSYEEEE